MPVHTFDIVPEDDDGDFKPEKGRRDDGYRRPNPTPSDRDVDIGIVPVTPDRKREDRHPNPTPWAPFL